MDKVDIKTAVKRIAKAWLSEKIRIKDFVTPNTEKSLAYRYALEMCGLTLNEIIALGNADDIDVAVDELFFKNTPITYEIRNDNP